MRVPAQGSHLMFTFTDRDIDTTAVVFVSDELRQEMDAWLEENKDAGNLRLLTWLNGKGAQLDSAGDSPAWVEERPDGSRKEAHYRGGVLHRDNGPAMIFDNIEDASIHRYYVNGEFIKVDYRPPIRPCARTRSQRESIAMVHVPG